jgi:serine/threonine protein kinase
MEMVQPWDDKWEICVRNLGEGGQGTTHLVRSKETGDQAVLKELRDPNDLKARRRMRLEVVSLQTLAEYGARVPTTLDDNLSSVDEIGVPLYFVMEYADGHTLDQFIKINGSVDICQAICIVEQICETISIGHREKLLHRDLKPKNIMLCDDADGKKQSVVLDYGLSFNDRHDEGLTTAGESFWNEFLSLPETNVRGDDRRDFRTDITALCGLLFYCVSGNYPEQLMDSNARPPHRRPGIVFKGMDDQSDERILLDAIFTRGFRLRSNDRFQSVDEFVSGLTAIKSTLGGQRLSIGAIAQRDSELIRLRDRIIQLEELKPRIPNLYAQLISEIGATYKGENLGLFKIKGREEQLHTSEASARLRMELLHPSNRVWILRVPPHDRIREITYGMGLSGSEIHIYRYLRDVNPGGWQSPEFLVSYPVDEELSFAEVAHDFKEWLRRSMQELRDEIVPPVASVRE